VTTGLGTAIPQARSALLGTTQVSESELLSPYLPRLTVDWVAHSPEVRHRSVEGTVVFVDVSGFTKLSEKLAKHGKIGAEELAATIGECFVYLLEIAYANGGRLLKFGGDALLLLFSGTDHEARSCRAAFDMRRTLRVVGRVTVLGHSVTLRMSVGVHSGTFDMFLVGSSHRELVVTGPAASTTVAMEATAQAGEILISERTAEGLEPSCVGEARDGGRLLRRAPSVGVESVTPRDRVESGLELSQCIPAAVLGAIRERAQEPEHRRVAVAFVHFDGTDAMLRSAGPEKTTEYLDVLISDVQNAVDAQGVTFIGTDIDRDGGKVILVAGAPSTSGDDEHRMLLALREIMDRERRPPLRTGVNRGAVFAGDIGPSYRRTFTVMGDTVNLAARLMAKAVPGSILATPGVLARCRSQFELTQVVPFYVKGVARAVEALEVGARIGVRSVDSSNQLPLVARDEEMKTWHERMGRARAGSGSVLEVVGEPGVGKSRLLSEFKTSSKDFRVLSATCDYYESATPYGALRSLVRGLLGIDLKSSGGEAQSTLLEAVKRLSPQLAAWAPLVGAVVDVEMPETAESAELDAQFVGQRRGEVVTQLLGALLPEPTVLFVEDAHLIDEASSELLGHITANIEARPWVFCFTRRDVESGFVASTASPSTATTTLRLAPLDEEASARLVHLCAQGSPLPEHTVAVLTERSGGNPLFLRELLAAAREGGDIDSLPDSVEAVIATRIDRLSAEDRHLLRRVSVLGRSAPFELLGAVLEAVPGRQDPIWARLEDFVTFGESGDVVFGHALLRDGAYDGLSYRLRRQLHGNAADAIRLGAGDRPEEHAELLSLHYLRAQRYADAWTYSLTAAERARSVYANIEAAEFFERALSASRHLPALNAREVSQVHESLAEARHRTGQYTGAVTEYRAARRLVHDDVLSQVRLMLKLAQVQGWLDRYSNALRWITRALRMLDDEFGVHGEPGTQHDSRQEDRSTGDGERAAVAQRQRAQLLAWYGRFCQEQGHHARAIKWCRRAVSQAELADEKEALANALAVLDWAQMDLGILEHPTNWQRGLAQMEELGDLQGQAMMLNSLGVFAYFRGRWDESLDFYMRAQEKARRVGNSVQLAFYENNVAEIALDQGRVDEARRLFESVSRIWRAAGYKSGAAYAKSNLARCAAKSGYHEEAMALFAESWEEAEAVGSRADSLEAGARWAECELLAGDLIGARSRAEAELDRARMLGGGPQLPLLHRVRGVALARLGREDEARRALEESLAAAQARKVDYEAALTLGAMGALGFGQGGRSPELLGEESKRVLASLGVVWIPDLLAEPS
jgi:class 3 adenylate cyclase/tetratricopeptide (TPR) repeat protein